MCRGKCAHAKSPEPQLTACEPMDCSPPASLSVGIPRQEHWRGLPCPPLGDLPGHGPNLRLLCLLHWQAGSSPLGSRRRGGRCVLV